MFFSVKDAGETRAEKRLKEKARKESMEAEMAAYLEKEASASTQDESASGLFARPRTGGSARSAARNRIATPGEARGASGRRETGSSSAPTARLSTPGAGGGGLRRTPKRRGGI